MRLLLDKHQVVSMSYEVLRSDIQWVASIDWDYCILDEGHTIKNAKSKIAAAAKQVRARHRLLLSGTPLQNNVLELWSLFDFLMPGFLGTERQFNATYGKSLQVRTECMLTCMPPLVHQQPCFLLSHIIASHRCYQQHKCTGCCNNSPLTCVCVCQEARSTGKRESRAAQAGLLALDGLHRTVMPFILRRTKEQVLSDLPPKIITDVYCNLSPLQQRLYEAFTSTEVSGMQGVTMVMWQCGSGCLANGCVSVHHQQQPQHRHCNRTARTLLQHCGTMLTQQTRKLLRPPTSLPPSSTSVPCAHIRCWCWTPTYLHTTQL